MGLREARPEGVRRLVRTTAGKVNERIELLLKAEVDLLVRLRIRTHAPSRVDEQADLDARQFPSPWLGNAIVGRPHKVGQPRPFRLRGAVAFDQWEDRID